MKVTSALLIEARMDKSESFPLKKKHLRTKSGHHRGRKLGFPHPLPKKNRRKKQHRLCLKLYYTTRSTRYLIYLCPKLLRDLRFLWLHELAHHAQHVLPSLGPRVRHVQVVKGHVLNDLSLLPPPHDGTQVRCVTRAKRERKYVSTCTKLYRCIRQRSCTVQTRVFLILFFAGVG